MMVVGPSKYDKYLTPYLRHGMYFRRFSEQGTDISASPVAKGPAIVWLLDYLNLTKDNAISFGDSDLDISSFENTTYSVCMGNAKDEIKKEAAYVAPSIKESGVADFIKKHLF